MFRHCLAAAHKNCIKEGRIEYGPSFAKKYNTNLKNFTHLVVPPEILRKSANKRWLKGERLGCGW